VRERASHELDRGGGAVQRHRPVLG
jgi:hypothetical protein